jgi:hypothetical protein
MALQRTRRPRYRSGRVGPIGLVAQDVSAHVLRRQEQDSMAQTSFQKNCRRRMLSEETGHLDAREPAPLGHAPGLARNRDSKTDFARSTAIVVGSFMDSSFRKLAMTSVETLAP